MQYDFKKVQELIWVAVVAAGVFALQILVDFDPQTIKEWDTWAIAAGGGAVRAVAAALLAWRVTNG